MIFDTHAHYDDEQFNEDREELLKELPELGVETVVNVGASLRGYRASMEFAKKYLKETGLTISEIAIRVGYNNFSYFSKTFKDYTGKTPNEFRICTKSTQI